MYRLERKDGTELSTGRMNPRVGSGQSGRIASGRVTILPDFVSLSHISASQLPADIKLT